MGNGRPIPPLALDSLLVWNRTYETVCLHPASGYKTPDQFYHYWLNTNAT